MTEAQMAKELEAYLQKLGRLKLNNPVLVGFGIRDKAAFNAACRQARGAIIGSAFIKSLEKEKPDAATRGFITSILG